MLAMRGVLLPLGLKGQWEETVNKPGQSNSQLVSVVGVEVGEGRGFFLLGYIWQCLETF